MFCFILVIDSSVSFLLSKADYMLTVEKVVNNKERKDCINFETDI